MSALPAIHEWEDYMDAKKVAGFPSIDMSSFLCSHDFRKELAAAKTSDVEEYRTRCEDFIDRFIYLLLERPCATSGISRGLYNFCPEIMLEGNNSTVFGLFSDLCAQLRKCGVVSADGSKAAVEEYNSYVIEKRRQHVCL